VDPRFYCTRYLRSWALEALLAGVLRERFDEDWFRNPRAAAFVGELFAAGQVHDADALALRLTGAPLDFRHVRPRLEDLVNAVGC
jgi:hypothetical protein